MHLFLVCLIEAASRRVNEWARRRLEGPYAGLFHELPRVTR
jgi:hypothetical protein